MNVAILVECGRDGLEDVVVRRICELLEAEIDIVPMDNKPQLIRECGRVVAQLLKKEAIELGARFSSFVVSVVPFQITGEITDDAVPVADSAAVNDFVVIAKMLYHP